MGTELHHRLIAPAALVKEVGKGPHLLRRGLLLGRLHPLPALDVARRGFSRGGVGGVDPRSGGGGGGRITAALSISGAGGGTIV